MVLYFLPENIKISGFIMRQILTISTFMTILIFQYKAILINLFVKVINYFIYTIIIIIYDIINYYISNNINYISCDNIKYYIACDNINYFIYTTNINYFI